ncbi:MAG: hypothetical protein QM500_16875 [Methylococcales bacterium]
MTPIKGRFGYTAYNTPDYWSVSNGTRSANKAFKRPFSLNWISAGSNLRIMTVDSMSKTRSGKRFCKPDHNLTNHAALKINGKWVKSEFSCQNGALLFSLVNMFTTNNLKISVATIFDSLGNPAKTYDLRLSFDNTGVLNAMKYAYDKSVVNERNVVKK